MKFKYLAFLFFAVAMLSCSKSSDSLVGEWSVKKINFEFDEKKSTPEMIRQFGEQERGNVLNFKNDSVVHIKMAHLNDDFFYSIDEKGVIIYSATPSISTSNELGQLKNGTITSKVMTVIGEMKISYERK